MSLLVGTISLQITVGRFTDIRSLHQCRMLQLPSITSVSPFSLQFLQKQSSAGGLDQRQALSSHVRYRVFEAVAGSRARVSSHTTTNWRGRNQGRRNDASRGQLGTFSSRKTRPTPNHCRRTSTAVRLRRLAAGPESRAVRSPRGTRQACAGGASSSMMITTGRSRVSLLYSFGFRRLSHCLISAGSK